MPGARQGLGTDAGGAPVSLDREFVAPDPSWPRGNLWLKNDAELLAYCEQQRAAKLEVLRRVLGEREASRLEDLAAELLALSAGAAKHRLAHLENGEPGIRAKLRDAARRLRERRRLCQGSDLQGGGEASPASDQEPRSPGQPQGTHNSLRGEP